MDYLNLKVGAKTRLQILKNKNPQDWRKARYSGFDNCHASRCELSQGFNGTYGNKKPVWYCHTGAQFRGEEFAHEFPDNHIDHRGWYTNENGESFKDGSGLARGIVARLPHGRYITGYWWGDNGERVYFPEVYDNAEEACRAADSHAEKFADMAREDNAKWNRARELESEAEEKTDRLLECLKLASINHKRESMRDEARDLIDRLRDIRKQLKEEFADYC